VPIPHEALRAEVDRRVANAKAMMAKRDYDVLIVYGNNKLSGSLRYITDYFPDRAGWISLTGEETAIVDGAAAIITRDADPLLLVDPGLMPTREICVDTVIGGDGFAAKKGDGLSVENLERIIRDTGSVRTIGIETWDKFPTPLYLGLKESFGNVDIVRSTIIEELRLIKSDFDLEMMRRAAAVADLGHETFLAELEDGIGKTELQLIRATEHTMRSADPMYEDSCSSSPSLICTGFAFGGALLHLPSASKSVQRGNIVHWDICMRCEGYPVDTSRTRIVGKPTEKQVRAYDAILEIHQAVVDGAKPGVLASALVSTAETMAQDRGFRLWNRFLGHGLGWDIHERPDMGIEEMPLAENMVLAIEPRLSVDDVYLVGNEDMVQVTADGGLSLTAFPKEPFEL
jgi:Xaa-Pro aminopeptidase